MGVNPFARSRSRGAVALLAALAYVPLLLSRPGQLPADTKLGLTVNPATLMGSAVRSWDVSQFAGWVPHQGMSYLWPSGPFYWVLLQFGLPEWVVQRLAVGSLLFAAGAGVLWFVRRRGYSTSAALVAALVYQLSPYVLPYTSRTSLMLLPWAGLPWLMGLADDAAKPGASWRRSVAVFGLVIATVGGLNLTATLMIAPGPILLLLHRGARRETPWWQVAKTGARLGIVSIGASLWWLVMLAVQGHYGAKVLGYTETLEAVSATSTAPEVLRGTGYWLSYVHAPTGVTTTAGTPYMTSPWLITVGFVLLASCLAGLALLRFRERALAGVMLVAGVVLAVGVHPIADPSPLFSAIADDSRSTLALAMRSSTRAVPLVLLACGLAAAAMVDATSRLRARARALVVPGFIVLAVLNQPALFTGDHVDPELIRDNRPPAEWYDAADVLDAGSTELRVLQLPGVESQTFDWGRTVDPPLAWMTDKPLLTRDWLPLGSPAAMDLLFALDDRFQADTIEPEVLAPAMRLLAADTVWLALDADFERYDSATPAAVEGVLDTVSELAPTVRNDRVTLYSLASSQPITRAATNTVVLYGSGDGLLDAAAAGLLHGDEAILYAADLTDEELHEWARRGALFLLTDSNRDRAHQWRGSQDVWGFTETGGPDSDVLRFDPQDARLPVFAEEQAIDQTIAITGNLWVRATYYGSGIRYLPQYRPAMAIDGDPTTAWLVGIDDGPRVGEQLLVSGNGGEGLSLSQPTGGARITKVLIESYNDSTGPAQTVDIDPMSTEPVTIDIEGPALVTIEAVEGDGPVGFSEILATAGPEVIRVPELRVSPTDGDAFALVVTRLRENDIEPVLRRQFETPQIEAPQLAVQVRGTAAAGCRDDLLELDGVPVPLEVSEAHSSALSDGDAVTLQPCAALGELSAGVHLLEANAGTILDVDRVTLLPQASLSAPPVTPAGAAAPVVTIDRGVADHEVTISTCPDGCWLIFGEGFSPGWSAMSDDADLGRHLPISGGFNGWWVQPAADGTATVHLRWAGQRPVWFGLAASAVTVVVLLALALWPSRRRVPAEPHVVPTFCDPRVFAPQRRAMVVGACAVLGVAVFVSPLWAALSLPVVVALHRRPRLLAAGAVAAIMLGGGAIAGAVLVRGFEPAFWWPATFERLHRPLFAAVVLLGASCAGSTTRTE